MRVKKEGRRAAVTAQWKDSFEIDGVPGGPVRLRQLDRKTFALESTVRYLKDTGLERRFGGLGYGPAEIEAIRTVAPEDLPLGTDLVSVPKPLRWFIGKYGDHTPAALVHDRFIGIEEQDKPVQGMTDEDADRYFRFMLHRTGVPWLRRWMMWSAVALRTRFAGKGAKPWTAGIWVAAVLASWGAFAWQAWEGELGWIAAAVLAPIPLSLLWWRQCGAALVAAYATPLLAPPAILALAADGIYYGLEWVARVFQTEAVSGTAPIRIENL
jgi:hypothetical protein